MIVQPTNQPTSFKDLADLPQLIDDCHKYEFGFVVKSQGQRLLFKYGELTPRLKMQLEELVDEYRKVN